MCICRNHARICILQYSIIKQHVSVEAGDQSIHIYAAVSAGYFCCSEL
jgi:hypothetical protein